MQRSAIFLILFILFYHWLGRSCCLNIACSLLQSFVSSGLRAPFPWPLLGLAVPLLQVSWYVSQLFPFCPDCSTLHWASQFLLPSLEKAGGCGVASPVLALFLKTKGNILWSMLQLLIEADTMWFTNRSWIPRNPLHKFGLRQASPKALQACTEKKSHSQECGGGEQGWTLQQGRKYSSVTCCRLKTCKH